MGLLTLFLPSSSYALATPFLRPCYDLATQCYFYEQTDSCSEDNTDGVGKEVEPFTGTGGGAVGLEQFHESAKEYHAHDGKPE